eukprot:m.174679 g.174679  ORF g.174679 m.174679 type:complete len:357 (-) comp18331_c0_seq1:499-1569(-)
MGERKVLNKYYPPDFDPAKIPRRKMPKDRQYTVRLMAPFNMRCTNCGEFIYKGKKFNARKETVLNETYLGLYIFRFYIRCTRCAMAITFKTDPKNTDYVCEEGATRNHENWRMTDDTGEEAQAQEEFEEQNPMAALENRTKESKREMDILDALEEIKDANARKFNLDIDQVLAAKERAKEELIKKKIAEQEAEDDAATRAAFGGGTEEADGDGAVRFTRRLESSDEDEDPQTASASASSGNASDIIANSNKRRPLKRAKKELRVGNLVLNRDALVRPKQPIGQKSSSIASGTTISNPVRSTSKSSDPDSDPRSAGKSTTGGAKEASESKIKPATSDSDNGGGGGLVGDYGSSSDDN